MAKSKTGRPGGDGGASVDDLTIQREVVADLAADLADVVYALQVRPTCRFDYVSHSVQDVLEYTADEFYEDVDLAMRILDLRDRRRVQDAIDKPVDGMVEFVARFWRREREPVWFSHRIRVVSYDEGQVVLYGAGRVATPAEAEAWEATFDRATSMKVSSGKAERASAAESETSAPPEQGEALTLRIDNANVITSASPGACEALGWSSKKLVGRRLVDLTHPDDLAAGVAAYERALADGTGVATGEARLLTATQEWVWMRMTGRLLRDEAGAPIGSVIDLRDIRSEMLARAGARHAPDRDELTGLASRSLALLRIQELLSAPDRSGLALLCASVDGLTGINENYTHTAGDRVLTVVAQRLAAKVGSPDNIGRIAGGEFVIMLPRVYTSDEAGRWATELLSAVRGPVSIGAHEIDVSVSIGVAIADTSDAGELLRDATTAMRQASVKGHDRWEFLDAERAHASRHRLAVQTALRQALNEDRIRPWYQPVVRLTDNAVMGYEALVRWERADGTVLEPAQFFDAAERSYLITTLDRIVLRHALDDLASVAPHLTVASNVSGPTLSDPSFLDYVVTELERSGIAPERLHLEVTETSLIDVSDAVIEGMTRVADMGVRWYVDDFGTGYSSISHLRDLPIGGLKLDRSFTMGVVSGDERSIRLSQGLAGLSRGLNLDMVVEGVQGERDAAILLGQGWRLAQGWYFGKPTRDMVASIEPVP